FPWSIHNWPAFAGGASWLAERVESAISPRTINHAPTKSVAQVRTLPASLVVQCFMITPLKLKIDEICVVDFAAFIGCNDDNRHDQRSPKNACFSKSALAGVFHAFRQIMGRHSQKKKQ